METITLTFNPAMPYAASIAAFVKTLPQGVKVSKGVKPLRKRRSNRQVTLDALNEVRSGGGRHYDSLEEFYKEMGLQP